MSSRRDASFILGQKTKQLQRLFREMSECPYLSNPTLKIDLEYALLFYDCTIKDSKAGCAQCKEKALDDKTHLIAVKHTTAHGGEGIFSSPAKVFNHVKPEGLGRCLIIKGV